MSARAHRRLRPLRALTYLLTREAAMCNRRRSSIAHPERRGERRHAKPSDAGGQHVRGGYVCSPSLSSPAPLRRPSHPLRLRRSRFPRASSSAGPARPRDHSHGLQHDPRRLRDCERPRAVCSWIVARERTRRRPPGGPRAYLPRRSRSAATRAFSSRSGAGCRDDAGGPSPASSGVGQRAPRGPTTIAPPRSTIVLMPASAPFPADVLVAFGITGDLARQMTFSARYRLERRGLLRCLVVGVAVDDWTIQISATTPAERSRLAGGNTPWCAPVGGQHR
jgi:hypothetical protein